MRILFWNLNQKGIEALLAAAAHEHDVDIVVLAECAVGLADVVLALNKGQSQLFGLVNGAPNRLTILSRLPTGWVEPVQDSDQVSIRRVRSLLGEPFLLVCAHLPSRQHQSEGDQADLVQRLAVMIRMVEDREGHARTVLVGDLNMDPFDRGVSGSEGLHAVMDRRVAMRGSRVVQQAERRFFYNPMWSRLGDTSPGPPGTYFYERSSPLSLYWHSFDQVLVRPALLRHFTSDSVRVLTSAGGIPLLRDNGTPDTRIGSDHLPLIFELDLDAEAEKENIAS